MVRLLLSAGKTVSAKMTADQRNRVESAQGIIMSKGRTYGFLFVVPVFILTQLFDDKVRIFGYEKVSGYLSYENQIKILLIALLGTRRFDPQDAPMCLNFLSLCENIEKRYEAINEDLNRYSTDSLTDNEQQLDHFFSTETGLMLKKEFQFVSLLFLQQ